MGRSSGGSHSSGGFGGGHSSGGGSLTVKIEKNSKSIDECFIFLSTFL